MANFKVNNIKLAAQGEKNIEWSRSQMPALVGLQKDLVRHKPFQGVTVGLTLHVTKETAVLVETLQAGGASVFLCSCNPLSTQDDVAAALAFRQVPIFAWRGESQREYWANLGQVVKGLKASKGRLATVDDGADLVTLIHKEEPALAEKIKVGTEETTTGVTRLEAMAKAGKLRYPVVAVNDNQTKHLFDNIFGTGQSAIDGLLRATNILLAAKNVVICGYGDVGVGIARRARGMGAQVIVCEVDPVRALQAKMDGYEVMRLEKAASLGDIFITATGNRGVIGAKHFRQMKNGAILANAGHFDVEIEVKALRKLAKKVEQVRPCLDRYYFNGRWLYLCGQGRLVNLACAEGHPSEVMALSFMGQVLGLEWGLKEKLSPGIHLLPEPIDRKIAQLQLSAMGLKIDSLTGDQKRYLSSWGEGS